MPSSGFWSKKDKWYVDFFHQNIKMRWFGLSLIWNRIRNMYAIHTVSVSSILSVKCCYHQVEENRIHKGKPQNTSILFTDHIFHYIVLLFILWCGNTVMTIMPFFTSIRNDFLQNVWVMEVVYIAQWGQRLQVHFCDIFSVFSLKFLHYFWINWEKNPKQ